MFFDHLLCDFAHGDIQKGLEDARLPNDMSYIKYLLHLALALSCEKSVLFYVIGRTPATEQRHSVSKLKAAWRSNLLESLASLFEINAVANSYQSFETLFADELFAVVVRIEISRLKNARCKSFSWVPEQ